MPMGRQIMIVFDVSCPFHSDEGIKLGLVPLSDPNLSAEGLERPQQP
jgi:hypothetical protein